MNEQKIHTRKAIFKAVRLRRLGEKSFLRLLKTIKKQRVDNLISQPPKVKKSQRNCAENKLLFFCKRWKQKKQEKNFSKIFPERKSVQKNL